MKPGREENGDPLFGHCGTERNARSPVALTKETFPLDVIACFCSFFYHNNVFLF